MHDVDATDEFLMTQVAKDDRAPLEILVRRHATGLLTFMHRMTGDRHRAEELMQEAFLAVWLARAKYRYPSSFRNWLFAIAANKGRAAFRAAHVRTPLRSLEVDPAEPLARGSPSEAAIAVETAAIVEQAVTELPEKQRLAVVLKVWNGLSSLEIASVCQCTPSTARANLHHGLAALRVALAKYEPD